MKLITVWDGPFRHERKSHMISHHHAPLGAFRQAGDGLSELPSGDELIASAAHFLIEGAENDAASLLLSCTGGEPIGTGYTYYDFGSLHETVNIHFRGPRSAVDILKQSDHVLSQTIQNAISAVLPHGYAISAITISASVAAINNPEWREELLALARGTKVFNQAPLAKDFILWQGLRFQSPPEVRIAEALDAAKVMFFPLCRSRVNGPGGRVTREPDFLICHAGKWGILEVDGATYHPPTRTVHDHERDRLFQAHGVRVVQHYDATRCQNRPDDVVSEFLRLLVNAY